jgi:hypothetical protein
MTESERPPSPLEQTSWAVVTRIDHRGTTARRYDLRYPPMGDAWTRALEKTALAHLAAVAATPFAEPRLCRWLEVAEHADPAWAIEQDFDGLDVVRAWALAARVRPHEIELAWRPAGAMANDRYEETTIDPGGHTRTRTRQGPWDPADPIDFPSARRHRTVRVRQPPIAAHLAARVIVEAGRAVASLHAVGLVHGMLTTEAIALARDGQVVIHRIATYAARLRGAHYVGSGTSGRFFAELAPEQLDDAAATPATDVFQLASALYELLAFSPAWLRATASDSIDALRGETLAPISSIHAGAAPLDAILARCLARDPRGRPGLAELITAIDIAFPARADDAAELARVVADAARAATEPPGRRDVPM